MKALALTLALLAGPVLAQEDRATADEVCAHAFEIGRTAMGARQAGLPFEVPMHDWVEKIDPDNPWRLRTLNVLIGAYTIPVMPTLERRQRIVAIYANGVRDACYAGYGDPT